MIFRQLFDRVSCTYTYLLGDEASGEAVLIDPVAETVERDMRLLDELDLKLRWILETHVHADHVTGAGTLRAETGAQSVLAHNAGVECANVAVRHGDTVQFGGQTLEVRETPGHTDGCLSYVLRSDDGATRVFTGDALLIRRCGRTDFQQGDSRTLFKSVREQLFTLPDDTIVFPAHDYEGRQSSTIGEEKRFNERLNLDIDVDEFVGIMDALDLADPAQMDVALAANLACGSRGWSQMAPEVATEDLGRFRVIDVREPHEFCNELSHIARSELLPMGQVAETMGGWDKETPLLMVCRSGRRSGIICQDLANAGFREVYNLDGGMIAWNEAALDRCPHTHGDGESCSS